MAQNELHLGMVTSIRLQDYEIVVTVHGWLDPRYMFQHVVQTFNKRCRLNVVIWSTKYQTCKIPKPDTELKAFVGGGFHYSTTVWGDLG